MRIELYENVIQEANEEEVDLLTQPLKPINFAGTPFKESVLFEQVLREALSDYKFFGIFQIGILKQISSSRKPLLKSANFEDLIRTYDSEERYRDCVILPCNQDGSLLSGNAEELKSQIIELEREKENAYRTTLNSIINYRKVLENTGLLDFTRQLKTSLDDQNTDIYDVIKKRTKASSKNQKES